MVGEELSFFLGGEGGEWGMVIIETKNWKTLVCYPVTGRCPTSKTTRAEWSSHAVTHLITAVRST